VASLREDLLFDGPDGAALTVVLAHGAGAPMNTPFLNTVARGLAADRVRVARFEFPYMRARKETGRRGGAPDREPILRNAWKEVVEELGGGERLVIGGKSLGGRIASMVADEVGARGLVCLGYPFHPPGRPEKLRTRHLETLSTSALIVQGTRDPFGTPEDVAGYRLSPAIRVVWLEDGDHSWKPRASSGRTEAQNMAEALTAFREFLAAL
jgi:predicted alpha/beta-hydrolase family hydrolase